MWICVLNHGFGIVPLDEKIVFSFLFDDISLNVAVIDEPAMPTIMVSMVTLGFLIPLYLSYGP